MRSLPDLVAAMGEEMRPISVEIVTPAPTEFFHCMHCELIWRESGMGARIHAEQRASGLPPDLAEQYAQIGCWVQELVARHGHQVHIRIIDVLSLEGFYKAVRHRLQRFPAFVVDGRRAGGDLEAVAAAIERRLGEAYDDPQEANKRTFSPLKI